MTELSAPSMIYNFAVTYPLSFVALMGIAAFTFDRVHRFSLSILVHLAREFARRKRTGDSPMILASPLCVPFCSILCGRSFSE